MTSTSSIKSVQEAPHNHRFSNEKPPPGFEYIFGGFLLLGLLYGTLADAFNVLFEKEQQLGLIFAIAVGFVNLTNLFRIQRSPKGAFALLAGMLLAFASRLFDPSYIGLVLVFAPNGGYLIYDMILKPAIFRSSQRTLLSKISNAGNHELSPLVSSIHSDFYPPLLDILVAKKVSSDSEALAMLPATIQFRLAMNEEAAPADRFERGLPLLERQEDLSDLIPDLASAFEDSEAVKSHEARLKSIFTGETEALPANQAALLCMFFVAEHSREAYFDWLPLAFDILRKNNDPLVISWIEESLVLFPEEKVTEMLTSLKLDLSSGHFLNVTARWIGPHYLEQLVALLKSDDPNVLGTAAFIFRNWHEQGKLGPHEATVTRPFADVVRRIRSVHHSGENIYADELVADFEQILSSLNAEQG
ncbi:MAG: hypothetical protein P1V97_26230 [Planctomycetota bacterium]|nr:hypothetical protein [Planctomycetota bacterium]